MRGLKNSIKASAPCCFPTPTTPPQERHFLIGATSSKVSPEEKISMKLLALIMIMACLAMATQGALKK